MTNEQINAAIADVCGWVPDCDRGICWDQNGNAIITCPDYCNDLNAMHEAEKAINISYYREYTNDLYDIACRIHKETGVWMPYSATARQRAEAFLRTLGKWGEAQ
jgi:hypothetical protein